MITQTGPHYSAVAFTRTHRPAAVDGYEGYSKYKECLALEFAFRCAYCLSHQAEVASGEAFGGFEIEHFRPKSLPAFKRLRNKYENLLWACHACNHAKLDTWPSSTELRNGFRFVDPTSEGLALHLEIVGEEVVPQTPAGTYIVDEIDLNSGLHRHRRRDRAEKAKRLALIQALVDLRISKGDRSPEVVALKKESDALMQTIRGAPPFDAPKGCYCLVPQVPKRTRTTRAERKRLRAAKIRRAGSQRDARPMRPRI